MSETVPVSLAISVGPAPSGTEHEQTHRGVVDAAADHRGGGPGAAGRLRLPLPAPRASRPVTPSTTTSRRTCLASGKGFIDPYSLYYTSKVVPGASHPPLWTLVLSLGGVLGHQVLLRAAALQLRHRGGLGGTGGDGGREVAGRRAGLIAAGITALYPVFLIDDGSLLAETMVVPLVALVVWAFYRLWHRPSLARAALLGALCILCALTRSELVLLVGFLAVPAGLLCRERSWRQRLGLCAASLIAALCVFAPWWAYTLPRFSHPEFLSDQLGITLASANCNQTYHGRLLGYWSFACTKGPTTAGEDASAADKALRTERASTTSSTTSGRVPVVMAARFGRAFGLYVPVAGDRPGVGAHRPAPAAGHHRPVRLLRARGAGRGRGGGAAAPAGDVVPRGDHPGRGRPRGRGHLRADPVPHAARRGPRRSWPRWPSTICAPSGPGAGRHAIKSAGSLPAPGRAAAATEPQLQPEPSWTHDAVEVELQPPLLGGITAAPDRWASTPAAAGPDHPAPPRRRRPRT